jgi:hypothetical protein
MPRFTGGWIKVSRKLFSGEHDIGKNTNTLSLLLYLVAWANLDKSVVRLNGKPITVKRGQLVTGIRELADSLGVSKSTIKRQLDYLCQRDTIRTQAGHEGTLITIVNFSQYQDQKWEVRDTPRDTDGTQAERKQNAGESPNEEVKNIRIEEEGAVLPPLTGDSPSKREEEDRGKNQKTAEDQWIKTHKFFGKELPFCSFNEKVMIRDMIEKHGIEMTLTALRGPCAEQKTDTFNPGKFLKLQRVVNDFEKFRTLGLSVAERVDKPELTGEQIRAEKLRLAAENLARGAS